MHDTGLDLFCDAVRILANDLPPASCQIQFIITGFGGAEQITNLAYYCQNTAIEILHLSNVSPSEYKQQLYSCDAALALKIPDREITQTTFPSKVIEITSNGLLLISTRASDVPKLFDSSSAMLLQEASPQVLADTITTALLNRSTMQSIALNGQLSAMKLFESKQVGKRILDFIEAGNGNSY
jgi:glycosyltransferase involved in cell wall biosynthesis